MTNKTFTGKLPTILPVGYLKDRMNTIRTKGFLKAFTLALVTLMMCLDLTEVD